MTTERMLAMRAYGLGYRAASSERIVVTHRINVQSNHNLSTSLSATNAIRASNQIRTELQSLGRASSRISVSGAREKEI